MGTEWPAMAMRKKKIPNTYTSNNRVKLIKGGKDYFTILLQMIREAKNTLHFQTYIFDDQGKTGPLVAEALKEAAHRNVAVYLVVDGYASQALKDDFIRDLEGAGIHFRFFEPIFKSSNFYFGRRLHHKIVVADARYAMVAGVNIADRYNDLPGNPAWLDFAIHVEGDTAQNLCLLCRQIWSRYTKQRATSPCDELRQFSIPKAALSDVRIRRNDWVHRKNEISRTYIEMLRTAESHVTILCSYFLPGKQVRKHMILAIKRGVRIRVIASGNSDVPVAKMAERWLYDWMLRKGIELYEYQETVLHGKIATCDDRWMTGGSFNINNISAYASVELNLDVRNPAFAKEVREVLENVIQKKSIQVTEEQHTKTRNMLKQFSRWVSYQFIRMMFFLFTFYFRQKG